VPRIRSLAYQIDHHIRVRDSAEVLIRSKKKKKIKKKKENKIVQMKEMMQEYKFRNMY
jgi:hypothetical protein